MKDILIFVADWSLKSAAIVAFALACALLLSRRSASSKHLVWRVALAAVALMPLGMGLFSRAPAPAVMEPIQAPIRSAIAPRETRIFSVAVPNQRPAAESSASTQDGLKMGLAIYALGIFGCLFRWLSGYRAIRTVASTPYEQSVSCKTPVLIASDTRLRVPITYGWIRPLILLPLSAQGWPERRIAAALLHETAHIQRRDWAWQTGAAWLCAAQWFNPAMWLLSAALAATAERAADDEVLASGVSPATYAGELLSVAEAAQGRLFPATAMARPGGVATRLRRIMAKGIDRRKPGRRLAAGVGAMFFLCGVAFAVGTVAEGALEKARPTVAEARLKTGAVVRLAFVSLDENPSAPTWRPDGGPAVRQDIESFQDLMGLGNMQSMAAGERSVIFNYVISNLNCDPSVTDTVIYRIKGHPEAQYDGGIGQYLRDRSTAFNRDRWAVPSKLQSVDIDCAIASLPYQTIKRVSISADERSSGVEGSDLNGKPAMVNRYDRNGSTVHVLLSRDLDRQDVRLLAWNSQGQQLQTGFGPHKGEIDSSTGNRRWAFTFGDNRPSDIAMVEVQARKFERVTFKNIRLYPNSAP
ncbi:MAG TPA: M56 family metallopeptidase [Fimbriimonas sp.]|nr:M56 family metallopeptidase [Fimbriimonas sp.]